MNRDDVRFDKLSATMIGRVNSLPRKRCAG
jgi:hypothetical protein